MNVLIVDNYFEVIQITVSLLEAKGHKSIVSNFENSQTAFLENSIDAVIINADPMKYASILSLRDVVKTVSPEIPFLVSSILTDDDEIALLSSTGAQIVPTLSIYKAITNL